MHAKTNKVVKRLGSSRDFVDSRTILNERIPQVLAAAIYTTDFTVEVGSVNEQGRVAVLEAIDTDGSEGDLEGDEGNEKEDVSAPAGMLIIGKCVLAAAVGVLGVGTCVFLTAATKKK
jgi:hypothetical protein